jgi:hypothetical protein
MAQQLHFDYFNGFLGVHNLFASTHIIQPDEEFIAVGGFQTQSIGFFFRCWDAAG